MEKPASLQNSSRWSGAYPYPSVGSSLLMAQLEGSN